jgi:hypothetical protein
MSRKVLLAGMLAVFMGLYGQSPTQPGATQEPAGTPGAAQPNQETLNNGVNNSGVVITNGYATGVGGNGVLSTPTLTFASPAPTAGISNAGRAGISVSTPVNSGVQSTVESSTVVYTNAAPINPGVANVSTAANTPGLPGHDVGPSYYSDALPSGRKTSIGAVAAQFKAAKAAVNARTLTNDDVQQMLGSKSGVTMAKNMPPLGPGATPQSTTAQPSRDERAATAQSTETARSSASTAQQSQTGAAEQRAGTPPPATTQGQASGSEAAAGNSTTPQINPNQQSNDAQGRSKLPATSTLLPLLGLLGVVSGGLGMWFRKLRR